MEDRSKAQFVLAQGVTRAQYGALCWRRSEGKIQVLLITSRDTGRWLIPKGWPIEGLSADAVAMREAWEEAGVHGEVSEDCVGLYSYDKLMGNDPSIPCVVAVYHLKVSRLRRRYPERKERRRKWFTLERALEKVEEPELRRLIAEFRPPGDSNGAAPSGG